MSIWKKLLPPKLTRKKRVENQRRSPGKLINDGRNFAGRYDDDGELKGSAGKPPFKIIWNKELTNIVVIVMHYFDGIKLSYGGLVRAYSNAASETIKNAGIVEVYETGRFKVTF